VKQVRKGTYTRKSSRLGKIKRSLHTRYVWWKGLSRKQKIATIALPILAVLILIPILTYVYYARDISDQERLMNRNNTGVVFLDKNDKTFYSIGRSKQQDLVPLKSISKDAQHALIASEDKDFYRHGGFSILSIARALITNLSHGDLTAYGGSTLTQQLAKNTLLSSNKTFLRKYQELAVSIAIEQQYSKDEILAMYLNSVYFGENAFGIQDAANVYFGKKPADLDLAQSAMLVGLLPAPNAYSPISGNEEYARERQVEVLSRMLQNGYITKEQQQKALAEKLTYKKQSSEPNIAPHFVEMVLGELSDKYGYEQVMRSGYQVKTTLDTATQKSLNANLQANMPYIEANNGSNASGIAIDPKTGHILALVGSADYNNQKWGKVNMVTTARQPGSTFKAIYYAGALAEGTITPATVLHDQPINLDGWQPQNADRTFRGDVTARQAINLSLNIPSIEVMQKYGIDKSIKQAKSLGITALDPDRDYGLPLAIGSGEIPLLQMTNAYAALADKGNVHDTSTILSVKDKFNKQIYKAPVPKSTRGISEAGSFLISNILSDNAAKAPIFGDSLVVPGHTTAVKTGTTDENRDALTIGYTPTLAIGVWVGNNDNQVMYNGGSGMAGPIWRGTMSDMLANQPDQPFEKPASVVSRSTCFSNHGLATNDITNGTYDEYYLSSALPSVRCTPEEPMISVCEIDTGEIKKIKESDFDSKTYSKNTKDCKKPEDKADKTIEVCDLSTGEVVTIKESEYDDTKYSKDTTNCTATNDGTTTDPGTNDQPVTPPPQ
jgi:penicillin-binding protein 1A